jgi:hypothetical protein
VRPSLRQTLRGRRGVGVSFSGSPARLEQETSHLGKAPMTSPDHDFNPYHAWLGLDRSIRQPDYFQLLGISREQRDVQQIAAAAQRAATRVRGFRPGNRSVQWAALLDEIAAARACLSDPARRADYERRLASPGGLPPKAFHRPAPRGVAPGTPAPADAVPGGGRQPRAVPMSAPSPRPGSSPAGVPMGTTVGSQNPVPTGIPVGRAMSGGSPVAAKPVVGVPISSGKPTAVSAARRSQRSVITPAVIAAAACLILAVAVLLLIIAVKEPAQPQRPSPPAPVARARPSIDASGRRSTRAPGSRSTAAPQPTDGDRFAPAVSEFPPREQPVPDADSAEVAPAAEVTDKTWKLPEFPDLDTSLTTEDQTSRTSQTGQAGQTGPDMPPTAAPAAEPPVGPEPDPAAVDALASGLKRARQAAVTQQFDAALRELDLLADIPKTREHQAMYDRLNLLVQYAGNFRTALGEALAALEPGQEIEVGTDRVVGVVEVLPEAIKVRSQGLNKTWAIADMPPGLAVAIADTWLRDGDPVALVMKGAYLVAREDATPEELARARQWWQEAAGAGFELGDLPDVMDDSYDFETIAEP